ncbi:hypothetical protein [Sphingomonas sp.]|uniref:hypothetical protein n=1 Tax=Sphingomonas sp. TaxID=28214 RepID=UPI001ECBF448|nr:hypothetical protein [Sphingomonas sp.]MBX3593082.1 hypothetical protein [Sphingomonas sp.]
MRRNILAFAGILGVLIGLLWVAQGLGLVHWPPQSFMLEDRQWAIRGGVVAAIGVVLLLAMRRS